MMPSRATLPTPPLRLLGQIALGGVLAAHMVVPALPLIGRELDAGPYLVQMIVSVYVAGLAAGQLVYGPLAERFGERPVLLAGLTLFITASAGVAYARSIELLIAMRFVQSLGAAAGLVLARAIARRDVDAREATRRLALMNLIITLAPAIAPLIGSVITNNLGWRAIFGVAAALGILNVAGSWRHIRSSTRLDTDHGTILSSYLRLFVTPGFLGYALAGAGFTTSMYALLGTAPFILVGRLGFPAARIGPLLASATIGIWLGSIAASYLVGRHGAQRLLFHGGACVGTASFVLLALVLTRQLSVITLIADIGLFLFGVGLSGPPALALAMSANPAAIASASGAYGAVQMAVGALCSFCAALAPDQAVGAALTVSIAATLAWLSLRLTHRAQSRVNRQAAPDPCVVD
jgi:MFS transporter, DHA1 family, multidrug resistance protein